MDHVVRPVDQWPLFEVRNTLLPDNMVKTHFSIDLLICDVASLRLLMREWALFYENEAYQPVALDLRFRDYVLTENKMKESSLYKESSRFWDERIKSLPERPDLPLKSDSDSRSPRYTRISTKLDKTRWETIKQTGIKNNISASMVLLTAFSEVLANWSRNKDFCINTTIINRLPVHEQVFDIIGEFATFAPLEVNVRKKMGFMQLAHALQKRNWENLENRFVHGTTVLRKLANHKGESAGSVLPVVFTSTLVHKEEGEEMFHKQFGNYTYVISQTPQVWLDHAVFEEEDGVLLSWHYVDDFFEDGLIETMFEVYKNLLDRLSKSETEWDHSYDELLPAGQMEKRKSVNHTTASFPVKLLHEPFIESCRKFPGNTAILFADEKITYQQLDTYSNRIAGDIIKARNNASGPVAVIMDKSWQQIASVLGILKAGYAYLPVDPELPADRLRFILEDANAGTALIQPDFAQLTEIPQHINIITIGKSEPEQGAEVDLSGIRTDPSRLAYVIYTSGSTGQPKGVMISHQAAWNTIYDINERFKINEEDRIFALSELNFDLSVYDIFGALAAGAAIVIPRPGNSRNPEHWKTLLLQHNVTVWNSVPALMEMFIEYISHTTDDYSIRLALLSGDWIPVYLPDKIKVKLPQAEIISLGGATEASIWSIFYPVREVDNIWKSIPYGKPLSNQSFHVLDNELVPCPELVPGMLYIGGKGVAEGYLNNDELTNASFILHPDTNERLYKTGDIGRFLPDGNIEFLGREDSQVKISGFRIELEEIENWLCRYPGIKAAIAHVWEKKKLVAYVIPDENIFPDLAEADLFLKTKLPEYMIPKDYLIMESFPLSPNGKINKKSLPHLVNHTAKNQLETIDNEFVEKVKDIFAEIIDIDRDKIDIEENFFSMGGDSIMGIRIISRLNELGLKVSPQLIFEHPTIAQLVSVLEKNRIIIGYKLSGTVSLTPIQSLLLENSGIDTSYSNYSFLLRTAKRLIPDKMEIAFQKTIALFDIFRLHYLKEKAQWIQKYREDITEAEIDYVSVSDDNTDIHEITNKVLHELISYQDIESSLLIRLCLFDSEDESRILLITNELIMDFYSVNLFLSTLFTIYTNELNGIDQNASLQEGKYYRDWVQYLERSAAFNRPKANNRKGITNKVAKLQLGAPDFDDSTNDKISFAIDKDIYQSIDYISTHLHIEPSDVLLSALALTFYETQISEALQVDCVIPYSVAELNENGFGNICGNFYQACTTSIETKKQSDNWSYVKQIKESIRNAMLQNEYEKATGKESSGLKFTFNGQVSGIKEMELLNVEHNRTAKSTYPLEINAFMYNETMVLQWRFDRSASSSKKISELSMYFRTVLKDITDSLAKENRIMLTTSDFPCLDITEEDFETILADFSEK